MKFSQVPTDVEKADTYKILHTTPGLLDYKDEQNMVLIRKKVIDDMHPSIVGCPIFVDSHKFPRDAFNEDVESGNRAVGVVGNPIGFDEESNYFFATAYITDKDAKAKINTSQYAPSGSYEVIKSGPPGEYNGIKYDEEVLEGKFLHLAIVSDARYTDARIKQNSKPGGNMKKLFTFGKKENEKPSDGESNSEETKDNAGGVNEKLAGKQVDATAGDGSDTEAHDKGADEGAEAQDGSTDEEQVETIQVNAEEAKLDLGDGTQVSLSEGVAAYEKTLSNENSSYVVKAGDMVTIRDKSVDAADIIKAHKAGNSDDAAPEKPKEETKSNAEEEDSKEKEEDKAKVKSNSKPAPNRHFQMLAKANQASGEEVQKIVSSSQSRKQADELFSTDKNSEGGK